MASATAAELLDSLRRFHLLEPTHLEELSREIEDHNLEPRALARTLVQRDWLTPYQANQLFQGRGSDLLLGSYVLLERLGEGGMGAVFKARNWKLGQIVALKLIRKDRVASIDAVRRFQREIRAAAQVNDPHIVRAFDADEVGGAHLLVMEYVAGVDLARLVKEKGPLPVERACDCVRQAALGLQHVYERGLVHRDIKPSNLLLTHDGVVKILDLGLARLDNPDGGDASTALTMEGTVMGTPDFLAPEQAANASTVDIRADLYSLGCTLYYLLAGRPPFVDGTALQKLIQHRIEEPERLEKLCPHVPGSVAAVVRRLMAKRPEDRYPTPAEAAAALEDALRIPVALPVGATSDAVTECLDTPLLEETTVVPVPSPQQQPRKKKGYRWLAGGGVLLAALALVALLLWRPWTSHPPLPTTQHEDQGTDSGGEIRNSLGMKLVLIRPGKFLMGSSASEAGRNADELQHWVYLTRPFYCAATKVTVGQFRQFVQATGYKTEAEKNGGALCYSPNGALKSDPQASWQRPGFTQTDDHPVVCVSWNDARAFCDWLSQKEGRTYTLPTEAQWEYCCRAGSSTTFCCGDDDSDLDQYAWFAANAKGMTHPVGQKKPNAWGLSDVHGNAWEWTADVYGSDAYHKSHLEDPTGPGNGNARVLRGGSWSVAAGRCRAAHRNGLFTPAAAVSDVGFRVVCTAGLPDLTGQPADGWVDLFNGKDIDGWVPRGGAGRFRVEDGQIVGVSASNVGNSFLCTQRDYADFLLDLEVKIQGPRHAGVQLRSQCFDEPRTIDVNGIKRVIPAGRVIGYQVEIDPSPRSWTGGIYDEGRRGWLCDLRDNEPARRAFKADDWNKLHVECVGDSIKTWVNGVLAADLKDSATPSGFLGLQITSAGRLEEAREVRFRNLRLKELK